MKTKNLFPCLGVASCKAWACLGVALREAWVLSALIAALNLLSVGQAPAQTFTSLGNFHGSFDSPIFLGNTLYASLHGLVSSGNTFFGTVPGDIESDYSGMVYAVSADGTGFTNVYSFSRVSLYNSPYINADGAFPNAGLILSGDTLYGTTYWGGAGGAGTVFAVRTNGTGFTVRYNFTSDEYSSEAGLILSGNTLYGTTFYGGSWDNGTVYAVSTNGTGFTILHRFTATSGSAPYGNSDGVNPTAALIVLGNTLYGTASQGGTSGNGTVFAIHTDGTGFRNLHSFTATSGSAPYGNTDGRYPWGGLILSGSTLYGTAQNGGSLGSGTVFAVSTNGTGFTNLYSFTGGSNGSGPSRLVLSGNTLYGTTVATLFSISFQPQLTITPSGVPPSGIILSWPTDVAGFDYTGYTLQSTTNLFSPAAWVTNAPAPVVIAGKNTVTNSITAAQQFYRLIR